MTASLDRGEKKLEDDVLTRCTAVLTENLDLDVVLDDLISENLIRADVWNPAYKSLEQGRRPDAIRAVISDIKLNPPGYLDKFIAVLRGKEKTAYWGNRMDEEYKKRLRLVDAPEQQGPPVDGPEQQGPPMEGPPAGDETGSNVPPKQEAAKTAEGAAIEGGDDEERFVQLYLTTLGDNKKQFLDNQWLFSYKLYLVTSGAMTDEEYDELHELHKSIADKIAAVYEFLVEKRSLRRFVGLSAVILKYKSAAGAKIFPFVDRLGDRHPSKGALVVVKKKVKEVPAQSAAQKEIPLTQQQPATPPSLQPAPPPRLQPISVLQLAPSNQQCRLLWMGKQHEDFKAIKRVLQDANFLVSEEPRRTDRVTYWEATLFGRVQTLLCYLEREYDMSNTCQHMIDRFQPDTALLTGACTCSDRVGNVRLGDLVVAKTAVTMEHGMHVNPLANGGTPRFNTLIQEAPAGLIPGLQDRSDQWEGSGELWAQYGETFPLRPLRYQILWYTRLYLELSMEEERTDWLGFNGWDDSEPYHSEGNRKVMREHIPDLMDSQGRERHLINTGYCERTRGDKLNLPVRPVYGPLLDSVRQSMILHDSHFSKDEHKNKVHFGAILSTPSNPTGKQLVDGQKAVNSVVAADTDTYPFYSSCASTKTTFLSVKAVSLMDDGLSDLSHSECSEYCGLQSAAYGLRTVRHLYSKSQKK